MRTILALTVILMLLVWVSPVAHGMSASEISTNHQVIEETIPAPPAVDPALDPAIETTPTGVPVYRLEMDPADWETLISSDPEVLGNTEFNATFISGDVSRPAKIRLRGASTRYYGKKSFKLKFTQGTDFLGRKELNLLASASDPTFLLERFFYETMAQTGALASVVQHAELHVNNSYYGLMLDVESVSSKRFLAPHGLEENATIYRTNWYFMFREEPSGLEWYEGYDYQLTKVTNEEDPSLDEAIAFIEGLNRTPDHEFEAWLSSRLDVPAYVNYMVADTLISNDWISHSRSFIIHEPGVDRWWYVPWDLGNSIVMNLSSIVAEPPPVNHTLLPYTIYEFAYQPLTHGPDVGAGPEWSVLSTRVIDNPTFRAQYIARLEETLNTTFSEEALFPYIDQMYAQIEASALADPLADPAMVKAGPDWLKEYVIGRRAFLHSQLAYLQAHGQTDLTINEVGEGFVEIYNAASVDYDLSGYYLSNTLHTPMHHSLPNGTVVPAGGYLVVSDVEVFSSGGELGLFKPTTLEEGLAGDHGVIDLVYYGSFAPGGSYGRTLAGSETWAAQAEATPGY